jgi:hypothetical protein
VLAKYKADTLGNEKEGLLRQIMKAVHKKIGKDLKIAINDWNTAMKTLRDAGYWKGAMDGPAAEYKLVQHILGSNLIKCRTKLRKSLLG